MNERRMSNAAYEKTLGLRMTSITLITDAEGAIVENTNEEDEEDEDE